MLLFAHNLSAKVFYDTFKNYQLRRGLADQVRGSSACFLMDSIRDSLLFACALAVLPCRQMCCATVLQDIDEVVDMAKAFLHQVSGVADTDAATSSLRASDRPCDVLVLG